jgi:hypothetical protein
MTCCCRTFAELWQNRGRGACVLPIPSRARCRLVHVAPIVHTVRVHTTLRGIYEIGPGRRAGPHDWALGVKIESLLKQPHFYTWIGIDVGR